MKITRFLFMLGSMAQVVLSLAKDPATYKPGRLRKSLTGIGSSSLVSKKLWDQLCEYDRPGFHPNDRDTSKLIEYWRAELFGDEGALKDQLANSAASAA